MIWQPIETAPKDGVPVLVVFSCQAVKISKYTEGNGWSGAPVWFVSGVSEATHWMPLPEPPAPHTSP